MIIIPIPFDVSRHALALAEKHKKHDLYLKIQIDDENDYENALHYIRYTSIYKFGLSVCLFVCIQ